MRTTKPFATISFNTRYFLSSRLYDLRNRGVISFYCFIPHEPEEDEKKSHFHVFIIPDGQVDTDKIRDFLIEPSQIEGELLPLGCLPFRSSKFVDWYLYGLHDPDYLAQKGQQRIHHYTDESIVASDWEYFLQLKHTSDFSKYKRIKMFREMVVAGSSFEDLVSKGFVPVQQVFQYREMYTILKNSLLCNEIVTSETTIRNENALSHEKAYFEAIITDGELPFDDDCE